jgi:methenyltetrahydrofolate cyclohydrolase
MSPEKLTKMPLDLFTRELSGDSPAPGGGSVAALAGGLAGALCAMVSRLTLGRDKYKDAAEEMQAVIYKADILSNRLLELVEEDTDAYNKVTSAFRMPKETGEEKAARSRSIQAAIKTAATTPLETLRATADLCAICRQVVEKGNQNCITDAGVAVQLIRAAAKGAAYNVRINLSSIKDAEFCGHLAAQTDEALTRTLSEVNALEEMVERSLP